MGTTHTSCLPLEGGSGIPSSHPPGHLVATLPWALGGYVEVMWLSLPPALSPWNPGLSIGLSVTLLPVALSEDLLDVWPWLVAWHEQEEAFLVHSCARRPTVPS